MTEYIVAGTYEGGLLGLKCTFSDDSMEITQDFAFGSHLGCVKSLSCHMTALASGSSDENIHVFDLKTKKQTGTIISHDGSVNSLDFFGKNHLISGGEDGKLILWRCTDWEPLVHLKGHKDAILCAKFHPSGRLCISYSKDQTLRLWDLMRATCPISAKLHQMPLDVSWSPSGKSYAIMFHDRVRIVRIDDNSNLEIKPVVVEAGKIPKITSFYMIGESAVLMGCENGDVQVFAVRKGENKPSIIAICRGGESDSSRVKSLSVLRTLGAGFDLAVAESEGMVRIYSIPLREMIEEFSEDPDLILPSLQKGAELRLVTMVSSFDKRKLSVLFPEEKTSEEQPLELDMGDAASVKKNDNDEGDDDMDSSSELGQSKVKASKLNDSATKNKSQMKKVIEDKRSKPAIKTGKSAPQIVKKDYDGKKSLTSNKQKAAAVVNKKIHKK